MFKMANGYNLSDLDSQNTTKTSLGDVSDSPYSIYMTGNNQSQQNVRILLIGNVI